jgi:nitric oxide synthase-interacting protein
MRAFWLPSKTPEARALLGRPDMDTYCPASGKKLRLKDLIPVRLTRVPEGQTGFAMDPVTQDTFTNASRLVLLKPTGALPRPPRPRPCLTRCCSYPMREAKGK